MTGSGDSRNYYAAERTLLAAERTLLAWNRTSLALMGFGFLIERFGLYGIEQIEKVFPQARLLSFLLGLAFILLGILVSVISIFQYRSVLRTLKGTVPQGYSVKAVVISHALMALFGVALTGFLLLNFLRLVKFT